MVEFDRQTMAKHKANYRQFFCHSRFFRNNIIIKILNFACVFLQKKMHILMNTDIHLYQGSALFSITVGFAQFIVENEKEIKARFKYSLAADEIFLQTLIMKNSFYRNKLVYTNTNTTSNARLIDRSRLEKKNSPYTWKNKDLSFILKRPQDCCFARKFEESIDMDVVVNLYNVIKIQR